VVPVASVRAARRTSLGGHRRRRDRPHPRRDGDALSRLHRERGALPRADPRGHRERTRPARRERHARGDVAGPDVPVASAAGAVRLSGARRARPLSHRRLDPSRRWSLRCERPQRRPGRPRRRQGNSRGPREGLGVAVTDTRVPAPPRPARWQTILPIVPAVAAVLAQIAYPLTEGGARDAATVAVVTLLTAACLVHAALNRGLTFAVVLIVSSAGIGYLSEVVGTTTGYPYGCYSYVTDRL